MLRHHILRLLSFLSAGVIGQAIAAQRDNCSTGASASRTRASSSRYRPSIASSSASAVTPESCSPHSTTTKTSYSTIWETTATITSQVPSTISIFLPVNTTTVTTAYTVGVSAFLSTSTSTVTTTSTSYSTLPASTTTTIATASGFTPVSCLAAYLDPTVTSTVTAFTAATVLNGITTYTYTPRTSTAYSYTATITSVVTYDVFQYLETQTSIYTSVRADPTSTVYAACATNNVVSRGPFGSRFGIPSSRSGAELTTKPSDILDATECCAACQADPTCFVSTTIAFSDGSLTCYFFAPTLGSPNSTCDPTYQAAEILVVPDQGQDFLDITISNGACGQYLVR